MITSLRLALPRPMLIRIFALLLLVLGPLGSSPLKAFVDLAFVAEMQLVEASLTAQGATAATATPAQWQTAFRFAETALGQTQPRLRILLAFNLVTPNQIRAFVTAISATRDRAFWTLGKTDYRGPRALFASPFFWSGLFEGSGATEELKGTTREFTLNIPALSTNQFLTGLSRDASVGYGYYEQPGAVTSQPFTFNPREPAPFAIVLPLLMGHTGATVVGGSATGTILVGESFQGTGGSQTTTPVIYEKIANDPWTVRSIGGYPGAMRTSAAGISGDGLTVVGSYQDAQTFRTRAYLWRQAGGYRDLGVLAGQTSSQATATSHDGTRVVGNSGNSAFTWTQAGGMTMLPNLPMLTRAQALCISPDESFIGGTGLDASFRETAQLWAKVDGSYKTYDLGKLLGGYGANITGWTFNKITAIVKNPDLSYNIAGDATLNGVAQGYAFQLTAGNGEATPTINSQPRAQAVGIGGTAVFSVNATNATSYNWQRNGVTITGATNTTLTLANAQSADTGTYTCLVGNAGGVVSSAPAALTVANTVSRLNNLSVRSTAGTGANTLIVGLTTAGGTKDILLRGIGPTLGQFGVPGTLADPQLALFNSSSVQIAQNDDWGGGAALSAAFSAVGAFPLAATSKDAALLARLAPGGYSAQVSGAAGTTGVVLVESYDSDIGSPLARYTNLSARNQVGTGANILIVGFNLTGNGPKNLLIRAVGPTLSQFGVPGTLADPQLAVFNSGGTQVNQNDDWGGSAALASAFTAVGAFPLAPTSKDAALSVVLQPGSYTAQVSGVNNTTGVALVEIYELP
ncbi:MAG: immunoglobulin domain-containing protein [Opitutaceae bacterium]|nr:immunoglobulin domain-containing protein [Opitutaceae bacterium]